MCLIFIALRSTSQFPLLVAANRDEYHTRATRPAEFWDEAPDILAGRDLEAGGTWLGINRNGRFAALTNYREGLPANPNAPSRGLLVSHFLRSQDSAIGYLEDLALTGSEYNGFSLLAYDGNALASYCNREGPPQTVSDGIHGLSNRVLDTPWPKVTAGKSALQKQLLAGPPDEADLFALLTDTEIAAQGTLPDTGIGRERERLLSPRFILGPEYGTRCSTLLSIDRQGHARFNERSYDAGANCTAQVRYDFDIEPGRRAVTT